MVVHIAFLHRLDYLANWKLFQYSLGQSGSDKKREGLILQTTTDQGLSGWGEIAPLPGRSQENLSQAKEQLLSVLGGSFRSPLYPSVAFGLESALIPYAPISTPIPLWALLTGPLEAITEKALRAEQEGFTAVKIKVSHLTLSQAEKAITPLIGKFDVRIDVNRAWDFEKACHFFSQFPHLTIEEPTFELDKLHTFPFPFALDESLLDIPPSTLATFPLLTTLIIKPTLVGCSANLQTFRQLRKKILFTAAFESGIGTTQIATFAHRNQLTDIPLGLDTYRFLQEDLLDTPLDFSKGTLLLPPQLHINPRYLQEIAHG